jgi:hypothetical protein
MIPLVEIAKDDIEIFKYKHNNYWNLNLMPIKFDIPEAHWPKVLDWSYSNLSILYDIGYKAGEQFYEDNKKVLAAEAQPDAGARATGRRGAGTR